MALGEDLASAEAQVEAMERIAVCSLWVRWRKMGMLFSTSIRLVVSSSSSSGAPASRCHHHRGGVVLPAAFVGQRDELRRQLGDGEVVDERGQLVVGQVAVEPSEQSRNRSLGAGPPSGCRPGPTPECPPRG
jgi:hypothetical protein